MWLSALAIVLSGLISAMAALAVARSANKAAIRNAEVTSRTDIEREAFERAKSFYTDTIDRQAKQVLDLEADVAEEKRARAQEVGELRVRLAEDEREIGRLRNELDSAKRAIRRMTGHADT